jgi:hypothetical protein
VQVHLGGQTVLHPLLGSRLLAARSLQPHRERTEVVLVVLQLAEELGLVEPARVPV